MQAGNPSAEGLVEASEEAPRQSFTIWFSPEDVWLADRLRDFGQRLRPGDRLMLMGALANEPEPLQMTVDWIVANYELLVKDAGIFVASSLPSLASELCSAEAADAVESTFRPLVRKHGRGELALDRSVEEVRSCGLLKAYRGAELAAMFD